MQYACFFQKAFIFLISFAALPTQCPNGQGGYYAKSVQAMIEGAENLQKCVGHPPWMTPILLSMVTPDQCIRPTDQ